MTNNKTLPKKFRHIYRIQSTRIPHWNYANSGMYFITICTKNRTHFFGEISNGKMHYSSMGYIAENEWGNTKNIRPSIKLDEWIIMPNHLHGIVTINNPVETHSVRLMDNEKRDALNASLQNQFGSQSNNLASIIRGFKAATTKKIHQLGLIDFAWQPGFHEHIIRNEKSLNYIREYIQNNPMNWDLDENNLLR